MTKPAVSAEQRERILLRADFACEAREFTPVACFLGAPLQMHHLKRRWAGGVEVPDEGLMAVCVSCHAWITEHPQDAHDLGLAKWSYE